MDSRLGRALPRPRSPNSLKISRQLCHAPYKICSSDTTPGQKGQPRRGSGGLAGNTDTTSVLQNETKRLNGVTRSITLKTTHTKKDPRYHDITAWHIPHLGRLLRYTLSCSNKSEHAPTSCGFVFHPFPPAIMEQSQRPQVHGWPPQAPHILFNTLWRTALINYRPAKHTQSTQSTQSTQTAPKSTRESLCSCRKIGETYNDGRRDHFSNRGGNHKQLATLCLAGTRIKQRGPSAIKASGTFVALLRAVVDSSRGSSVRQ